MGFYLPNTVQTFARYYRFVRFRKVRTPASLATDQFQAICILGQELLKKHFVIGKKSQYQTLNLLVKPRYNSLYNSIEQCIYVNYCLLFV